MSVGREKGAAVAPSLPTARPTHAAARAAGRRSPPSASRSRSLSTRSSNSHKHTPSHPYPTQDARLRAATSLAASLPPSTSPPSPLATYILRRLIRGLASPRGGARQGFAAALTACLEAGGVSVTAALDCLDTELPPPSPSAKGTDARDASLGRVFGCAAIARGGGRELAGDAASSARVARALGAAALAGKSYAREAAAAALGDAAGALSPTGLVEAVSDASDDGALGTLFAGRADARALAAAEHAPALLLALRLWPHLPAEVADKCPLLPEGGGVPSPGGLV